jgi:hypothetical protein
MNIHVTSKYHEHLTAGIRSALVALTLLVAAVVPALAGPGNLGNPGIAPPQSHFRGQTYSEWSAAWFQWVMSLPSTHHPLFDIPGVDCSEGQIGKVWFIGGALFANHAVNRSCTIPAGTALFLNITANGPVDNTNCTGTFVDPTHFSIDKLRDFADHSLDSLLLDGRGFCNIDGVDVQGLSGLDPPYRVQSPVFSYSVPAADNLLERIDGACYRNAPASDRTVDEAVADGVYVMIQPLPIGVHTIVFGKDFGGGARHTYHITVTGPGK